MSACKASGPIARLHPFAERVRVWFFAGSYSALAAWLASVLLLAAVLVWFFPLFALWCAGGAGVLGILRW